MERCQILPARLQAPLLNYPDFDTYAYPALAQSRTVNLETLAVRTAEYCTSDNPPILHRKETLVTERGFNS